MAPSSIGLRAAASARQGEAVQTPEQTPTLTDGADPDRITLRPHRLDDVDDVLASCQDAETQRWTTVPAPYTRADAEAFVAGHAPNLREGTVSLAIEAVDDATGRAAVRRQHLAAAVERRRRARLQPRAVGPGPGRHEPGGAPAAGVGVHRAGRRRRRARRRALGGVRRQLAVAPGGVGLRVPGRGRGARLRSPARRAARLVGRLAGARRADGAGEPVARGRRHHRRARGAAALARGRRRSGGRGVQ